MPSQRAHRTNEDSEEARAFLQARVALFWKAMFFIVLLSSGLGALGAIAKPGLDFWLTLALTAKCGVLWWLCQRGQRSMIFSRLVESGGLLLNVTVGSVLGRFLVAGFARDRALTSSAALLMSDAYLSMLQLFGAGLMVAIRAALIPSQPHRTLIVTALIGIPIIATPSLVLTGADGWLAWRGSVADSNPWLVTSAVMMWCFVIITCTVISQVIYGLRAQVRHARHLGQYVLETKIGEGGMGEVYRARHGMMRRASALKLLRGDRAGEVQLRRFEREVQLTARLTHPNTITIFDYGRTHDGVFYYAMELLDGANLQRIVTVDGPQPAGRVLRILAMVCGALNEAHGIGLIHRDIKPANIMLCSQGGERDVVKLLDFGLVKELAVDGDAGLTGVSTLVGTPQYMAPEAILEPGSADVRSDIYAVGAVAYYLLAGACVFEGKTVIEVCIQHLHQAPEPLSARGLNVPAELEAIVLACLDKRPDRRPQSAEELRRRLEAIVAEPWDAERARAWWLRYQPELDGAPAPSVSTTKTIEVGGPWRSLGEVGS